MRPAAVRIVAAESEEPLLATTDRIVFLKEVPFFQNMSEDQLAVLAEACEEQSFAEDARIFNVGDAGGVLYVVVSGRVGIEQERHAGAFARVETVADHASFGDSNFFDDSPRSISAVAVQDTVTLRLPREPLIALVRQYPDLSLELINVLSRRLREANDRIAELTRTRPRELHKLYDQLG
jgi:CRP/FNR family transcriptional regulator, cyclic AMP receptor protein